MSVSPAESSATPARLASSQLRRIRRVVDAAIALAERGGFDAVRLRDVAEASGVALGTLYKYFRSKEDILLFAVQRGHGAARGGDGARGRRAATRPRSASTELLRARDARLHAPPEFRARGRARDRGGEPVLARCSRPASTCACRAWSWRRCAASRRASARRWPSRSAPSASAAIALVLEHVWFACLLGWVERAPSREDRHRAHARRRVAACSEQRADLYCGLALHDASRLHPRAAGAPPRDPRLLPAPVHAPDLRAALDAEWDELGGPAFREAMGRMGKDGWLGIGWPKEYGGQGRTPLEQFIFWDET